MSVNNAEVSLRQSGHCASFLRMVKCTDSRIKGNCNFACKVNDLDMKQGAGTCHNSITSGKKTCAKDYCSTCPEAGMCDFECKHCEQSALGKRSLTRRFRCCALLRRLAQSCFCFVLPCAVDTCKGKDNDALAYSSSKMNCMQLRKVGGCQALCQKGVCVLGVHDWVSEGVHTWCPCACSPYIKVPASNGTPARRRH